MERFDAILLDLDGVVYVGPHAVPHAAEVIAAARSAGIACAYITNNASRPPDTVADHLQRLGIPATVDEVVTSPQAAVSLLPDLVPDGSRILVIGGAGIEQALAARGYVPVRRLEDQPAAVMQGFDPDVSWRDLAMATYAVRAGLPWVATNPDLTFPTPQGIAPGNGALVGVVARTAGREPDAVAGKPEPPLLHEAITRTSAARPLMVGDRLDTDIEAGSRVGIPTLLVFTGVTTLGELLGAAAQARPTYLGPDLRVLTDGYPDVTVAAADRASCGDAVATVVDGRLEVVIGSRSWDAVRAAAALAWRCADTGQPLDARSALNAMAAAVGRDG